MTEPWAVTGDAKSVTAWSRNRLAFEPRGVMLEFRATLRAALKALDAVRGAGLIATYFSPNEESVDVENAALYNVGASTYLHLTAADIYDLLGAVAVRRRASATVRFPAMPQAFSAEPCTTRIP